MDGDREAAVASGFGRYENGDGEEDGDIFTTPNIYIYIIRAHNRFNQNDNNEST